ncbi:conserved oligomeric Golgi complex subunit 1-like [Phragmites australis]|uniref:conserved oligomeric Golgi complex subunit 1-like n=1 Tax=Phragmites australis TaxID=29695 RepID=UPI002D7A15AD|nr:conserved oligomeric Golgi complex subunit 1-like [Phragmites australis]
MPAAVAPGSGGAADAEELFRTKRIPEIRAAEGATRREISSKEEELRQLVGRSYRDLLDSADSILLIKQSSDSISDNLSLISGSLSSLSPPPEAPAASSASPSPYSGGRTRLYALAARAKYLVDTPEHIWGRLDEGLLLEAAGRYLRARVVHGRLSRDAVAAARFPLLAHQARLVEAFRPQIAQRARERLADRRLPIEAYADALSAAAAIDAPSLAPPQALLFFLASRRAWISQALAGLASDLSSYTSVLCDVARILRITLGHVGQLFVHALSDLPLFFKTVLAKTPPEQLFGGIPDPDEEAWLWKEHMNQLEATMVLLEPDAVARACTDWLKECCGEIFGVIAGGQRLVDAIGSGEVMGSVQRFVRDALDGREGLEGSLEQWLKSVFGSEIESPWDQIRGLILKEDKDIFEDWMEEAFVRRMKDIVDSELDSLGSSVNVKESVEAIGANADPKDAGDFLAYLQKPSTGGGFWFSESKIKKGGILAHLKPIADENDFHSCLTSYFGSEVSRIRDAIDNKCKNILEDLLSFVESHNSALRLKELVPYLQEKCYRTILAALKELEAELTKLSASLGTKKEDNDIPAASVIAERSLFIGRLLFALRYHSSHVPLILGSPREWVKEAGGAAFSRLSSPTPRHSRASFDSLMSFTPRRRAFDSPRSPGRQFLDSPRRQTIAAAVSLFGADDSSNPRLDELNKTLQSLCITAHSVWIAWVSAELSHILLYDLNKDDSLFSSTPLRGWEVTVIKQEETTEGPLEMQIALPSMPSLYIISFFYQACLEIHKVGGHILDRIILHNFAWELLQKVINIYENFLVSIESGNSQVSEKGILQILLDLRFIGDVLSGGKNASTSSTEMQTKHNSLPGTITKTSFRRKQSQLRADSAVIEPINKLINRLSQRLDPIDWATYEPYLWENEKQSYKRYVVLFGFLVQLNHMYTGTVQKLPTKSNTDSNIMICSQVPRFKYLPISAPAISSRAHKSSLQSPAGDSTSKSPWKSYSNGERSTAPEFDGNASLVGAAPLFKSFVTQVGSKFGENTSRWGSMLSDGQVGKLSDILPGPAAGFFSSFTSGARYDS